MPARYSKEISPLEVSFLHFGSSLLLAGLLLIGLFSLGKAQKINSVLGKETSLPRVRIETVEKRLQELNEVRTRVRSGLLEKEIQKLLR